MKIECFSGKRQAAWKKLSFWWLVNHEVLAAYKKKNEEFILWISKPEAYLDYWVIFSSHRCTTSTYKSMTNTSKIWEGFVGNSPAHSKNLSVLKTSTSRFLSPYFRRVPRQMDQAPKQNYQKCRSSFLRDDINMKSRHLSVCWNECSLSTYWDCIKTEAHTNCFWEAAFTSNKSVAECEELASCHLLSQYWIVSQHIGKKQIFPEE